MRTLFQTLLLVLPMTINAADIPELTALEELRWQHRVLLLWPHEANEAVSLLESHQAAIMDRELVWFMLQGSNLLSNYPGAISSDFGGKVMNKYRQAGTTALLIGKDGGVKHAYPQLDLNAVFRDIDTMPMRRSEIRAKAEQ